MATITVTNLTDNGAGSLRAAIAGAVAGDIITFDAGLSGGVIRLASTLSVPVAITIDGDLNNDGRPDITISGDVNNDDVPAAGSTTISDIVASAAAGTISDNVRVLFASGDITIDGLIITGGNATGSAGGGVYAGGSLSVASSLIAGNTASQGGGVFANFGTADITASTLSGNSATGFGNAAAFGNVALNLTNVTATGNTTTGSYALSSNGSATVVNSTVTGNVARSGALIATGGTLTITNSISVANQGGDAASNAPIVYTGLNIIGIGGDTNGADGRINAPSLAAVFASVAANPFSGVTSGVLTDSGSGVPTVALNPSATNPALDASNASAPATDARGTARQDLLGLGNNGSNFADLGAFEVTDQAPLITAVPLLADIAEDTSTAAAIKFSTLSVVDADGNNTLSLSGADATLFEIQADGIYLKAGTILDFETNPVLEVTLNVVTLGHGTVSSSASLNVTNVNEAPTATGVPGDVTVTRDVASNVDLSAVTISDPDAGSGAITVTLQASAGTLAATSGAGVTVGGSGAGTLTLGGTVADINTFLDTASNITYLSAPGALGNDAATLTFTVNDNGNTGAGGSQSTVVSNVNLDVAENPSLVVTTNLDVVDAFDGLTSLREAVAYANGKANVDSNTPDTITFDATVFTGGAASLIRLTNGELSIGDSVVIDGKTGIGVTITGDANGDDVKVAGTNITDVAASSAVLADNSRLFGLEIEFDINGFFTANVITLKGLTLTGGNAQGFGTGGAIRDFGINEVVIEDSEISGNNAGGPGGALFLQYLTISSSTLSGNVSGDYGGAIGVTTDLIMTNTTVANNSAGSLAGGVFVQGLGNNVVAITNSTITGNKSVDDGGAIYSNNANMTLTNSIVLGNDAAGAGIDEVRGSFTAAGLNIVGTGSDTNASDGVINADPTKVFAQTAANGAVTAGVLANNGGSVQTVALKLDVANPALDRSNASAPATDARAQTRQDIAGAGNNGANFADLGAFEAIDQPPLVTALPVRASIAENASTATAIKFANLTIVDADGNNTLTLTGADSALFEIQSDGIYLKAGTVLDFETNPVLDVTLNVATLGNGTISAPASFNVTDVNEAPTALAFSNTLASIAENASTAARRKVADITITDDALGAETITLTGADAAKFEVFGGDLYLKAGATLDFETNPRLDVTVNVDDRTLGSGIELSRALSVTVTDVLETISGSSGANTLNGTRGADRILGGAGNDTINGGAGDDIIQGGAGVDRLTGGANADTFVFASTADSAPGASGFISNNPVFNRASGAGARDVITDFTPGEDRISLSAIDANTKLAGNQAFKFLGTSAFTSTPGGLVYRQFNETGTANDITVVYGDVNGDKLADFQIELSGLKTLTAADFIL